MIIPPQHGQPMDYLKHFNFSDHPFKNTVDARFFYRGTAAAAVFTVVRDTENVPSIIHLKGKSKVGKTALLKRMEAELREQFKVVLVLNPKLTLAEILKQGLNSFGHSHKLDINTPEEELLGYFQNSVSDFIDEGFRILLAVDNSHELSPQTLSELYGLMELEPQWKGKVYLLLSDSSDEPWPVVPDILTEIKEMELPPLTAREAEAYISSRLKAVGSAMCFSKGALKDLCEKSGGLPEVINQLAERALLAAWSDGRKEVAQAQIKAAKKSLDNPLSNDPDSFNQAAAGQGGHPKSRKSSFPWPAFAVMTLVVLAAFGINSLISSQSVDISAGLDVESTVYSSPDTLPDRPLATTGTAEAPTPTEPGMLPLAPPAPPSQALTLPLGSAVLAIDQVSNVGELWQCNAKGPWLSADIKKLPAFKNKGLYLFGRQKGQTPLIFQYPPSRDIPDQEARIIWPRISTLLPQNIIPIIVGTSKEFSEAKNMETEEAISRRVKAWVQSQQHRFTDNMADLYASTFQFFELGKPARTINRENFRKALSSEARSSGGVKLATSQPLILQDPVKSNLVWAIFNIKYESKLRNDMGIRVLIFEKAILSHDNWMIVAELWLPEQSLIGD